jgi:cobyrinic acid a,c-diamide synthase
MKNPDIQYINPTITPKMFIKVFGRVHEKKATSASGRHLGHYKALMDTDNLVDLMCKTMSLLWKHGICLDRWLKVIDVMLAK